MKEVSSSIEIDASPERVWQVLTDFGLYTQWDPFIRRVRGKALEERGCWCVSSPRAPGA